MIQISPPHLSDDQAASDLAGPLAVEVCQLAPSVGPWPLRPTPNESADAYFSRLVEEERLEEAIRFIAICLQPRQVVWWGALSVWESLKHMTPLAEQDQLAVAAMTLATEAVDMAVAWVLKQDEDSRQAIKPLVDDLPTNTPAGALAMAVFWSGGNVSLPDCPEVLPPGDACQKLVSGAVLMATAGPNGPQRQHRQRQALRMAAEIQAGQVPWQPGQPITQQELSR